ncbi:LamG domain-containing protein [Candidatus Poribacteria bacterium]|nr:LamG domain-containing protein [Candidatus Poribacteria bacterium]
MKLIRYLVAALLLGAVLYPGVEAKPPKDLVLYLSFDEVKGKTVIDLSSYGNDAEMKGDVKISEGKFGKAVELDGTDDYLVVKNHPSLQLTTAITISCWVKITGGPNDRQSAVEKEPAWQAGEYNLIPVYDGAVLFQANDLPDHCDDEGAVGNVKDGKWHFVAGTWDGKVIRTYIDGDMVGERECAGKLEKGSGDLFIGSRGGTSRFLWGLIDEVKIYSRALSKEEIKADMENPRHNVAPVQPSGKLALTWGRLKRR